MAYGWQILKAAVEQEILFPSKKVFDEYCKKLEGKEEPFEVIEVQEAEGGCVIARMRKRYNNNAFLSASNNQKDNPF